MSALKCKEHKDEDVRFYCEDDKQLLCDDCIVGVHSGHRKIKLKDYAARKRQSLSSSAPKSRLSEFSDSVAKAKQRQTEFNESIDKEIEKAKNTRERIKKDIDELQDDLIENFEKARKVGDQEFDRFIKKQISRQTGVNKFVEEIEDKGNNLSDVEVVAIERKLSELLEDDPYEDIVPKIQPPKYRCQEEFLKKGKLQSIIGYMQSGAYEEVKEILPVSQQNEEDENEVGSDFYPLFEYKEEKRRDFITVNSFNREKRPIHIVPKANLTAWIISKDVDEIDCSDSMVKSNFVKALGEEPVCAARNNGKELVIGLPAKKTLKQLKSGGTTRFGFFNRTKSFSFTTYINTAPLQPVCICSSVSQDGDIIACLTESSGGESGERKNVTIRRYPSNKPISQFHDLNIADSEVEIDNPVYISENNNGDICIVSCPDDKSSWIVVLDENGKLKMKYPTKATKSTKRIKYDFVGASFLGDGTITVLDRVENRQHLVDMEGRCLQIDKHESQPACFASGDDDYVWVGFDDGQIKVMSYQNVYFEVTPHTNVTNL